jgi:PilZ domain
MDDADKRRAPRANVEVACALRRRGGASIPAETLNLGPGGTLVRTERPLSIDESLDFELDTRIAAPARVLRHEGHDIYALRFENPPELMVRRLQEIASGASL